MSGVAYVTRSGPPYNPEDFPRQDFVSGLVIVAFLGIFVGGFTPKDEKRSVRAVEGLPQETAKEQNATAGSPGTSNSSPPSSSLQPALAVDFVKWWLSNAMDYAPTSAQQSHALAFGWMTYAAKQAFESTFWPPALANGIADRQVTMSFQPTSVQAEAVNPDGSIVVGFSGSLTLNSGGKPLFQEIQSQVLVRKDTDGLRISGLYDRSTPIANSSY